MSKRVKVWLASGSLLMFMPLAGTAQPPAAETPQEIHQEVQHDLENLEEARKESEEVLEEKMDQVEEEREEMLEEADEVRQERAAEQREQQAERQEEFEGGEERDWSQQISDAMITARIETLFMVNDQLSALDIKTTTRNEVVTLEGTVSDPVERDLAEDLARSIESVSEVNNRLEVAASGEEARADTGHLRGRVSDANITAAVRSRLRAHDAIEGNVDVRTEAGTVHLSGHVRSDEQKGLAVDLAENTRGVREVEDELTVLDGEEHEEASLGDLLSDEWSEKRVEQAIAFSRSLSIWDLDVEVDNGVCRLDGTVASEEAKTLTEDIALDTRGVDEVINQITVTQRAATER